MLIPSETYAWDWIDSRLYAVREFVYDGPLVVGVILTETLQERDIYDFSFFFFIPELVCDYPPNIVPTKEVIVTDKDAFEYIGYLN